jgi:hypothetical protein
MPLPLRLWAAELDGRQPLNSSTNSVIRALFSTNSGLFGSTFDSILYIGCLSPLW